jgi:hypothetical protein
MELTTENVKTVFEKCITDSELGSLIIGGPVHQCMMSKEKLKEEEENIYSMLKQLPDDFMQNGGGGMSFLNACIRKDGVHWGEHINIEMLLILGFGINKASYCMPRDMWSILPGGMPYFVVR